VRTCTGRCPIRSAPTPTPPSRRPTEICPTGLTVSLPSALPGELISDVTFPYHHEDLSIDQQVALRPAAAGLAAEFDGTYGRETIGRFLHTSYDQFANLST